MKKLIGKFLAVAVLATVVAVPTVFAQSLVSDESNKGKFYVEYTNVEETPYISLEEAKALGYVVIGTNELESLININRNFNLNSTSWTTIGNSSTPTFSEQVIFVENNSINRGNISVEVRNTANQILGVNTNIPPGHGIAVTVPRNTDYTIVHTQELLVSLLHII